MASRQDERTLRMIRVLNAARTIAKDNPVRLGFVPPLRSMVDELIIAISEYDDAS